MKIDKYCFYLAISGGGLDILSNIGNIHGVSKSFVGANVPYSKKEFDTFIGKAIKDSYVSESAASALAISAFERANIFKNESGSNLTPVGIGVSCSVASEKEREDRLHKIYIVFHSSEKTLKYSAKLKQWRGRSSENKYIANIISALTYKYDSDSYKINTIFPESTFSLFPDEEQNLVINNKPCYQNSIEAIKNLNPKDTLVIIPGSFNPLHAHHARMYFEAKQMFKTENVFFELSLKNADKGIIDNVDLTNRLKTLNQYNYFCTLNAPLIKDKIAELTTHKQFDRIVVSVGLDTFTRIFDCSYGIPVDDLVSFFNSKNTEFVLYNREGVLVDEYFLQHLKAKGVKITFINSNSPLSSTQIRQNE